MYRALRLSAPGPTTNFNMCELPLRAPEPKEIRVRVDACAVAYRDVLDRQGAFKFIHRPTVLGHEFAGTVVAVGSAAREEGRFTEGDSVVSLHWDQREAWPSPLLNGGAVRSMFGLTCDGGYAEQAYGPVGAFGRAPVGLAPQEAACVVSTFGTVWYGAVTRAGMHAGHRVLVTGASGGVGSAAVQIAKAMGCARVCGVTGSPAKVDFLKKIGCDDVVVSDENGRFTCPFSADIAIEAVGGPTFAASLRAVAPGGRLVLLGNVSNSTGALPLGYCILNSITLVGSDSIESSVYERELLPFMHRHGLRPAVTEIMPLQDAGRAHLMLERRAAMGRIVLIPNVGEGVPECA